MTVSILILAGREKAWTYLESNHDDRNTGNTTNLNATDFRLLQHVRYYTDIMYTDRQTMGYEPDLDRQTGCTLEP